MRKNNWNEADANAWVEKAGTHDADIQLALRVYTSRLIGNDPDLVMHGGGNTSVKVKRKDIFGNEIDVLHVKGSGWDLDTIEAAGLPGVKMEPLHALRQLDQLSDEDMVNIQRANLIDTSSPNPSVETLLHAYLTHRFVDHTHATAFLALANLPDAEAIMREIFGDSIIAIPYIMPGFELAKKAADIFDANPDCEGMLLLNHGHFTFGDTAKESYDRIIDHTNKVEEWFKTKTSGRVFSTSVHQDRSIKPTSSIPTFLNKLRGEIDRIRTQHHNEAVKTSVFDIRTSEQINEFLKRDDLDVLRSRGVGSPDHVIRTKGKMLYFTQSELNSDHDIVGKKISDYVEDYNQIFQAQNKRVGGHKVMIEPHPVVVWVEGLGIIGIGRDAKAASAHADIAEQTIEVISLGEAAGGYFPIGADDNFDMEYWSLEQAKLSKSSDKAFTGQVVAITGGAGAIGSAIAKAFAKEGASIALIDKDIQACRAKASEISPFALAVEADLSQKDAAQDAINAITCRFGGLDILVSNAGYALQGEITDLTDEQMRQSFEVNFFAHMAMAKASAEVFEQQGRGGQMLFNASKQAVNPGKGFGAYGLPKATTFFLIKQLALELGASGTRVNGINADRIRSGLLTDDFISSRAEARQVTKDDYMAGNLLKKEVEAHHVAEAFVALAKSERTTAHIMTVDGGNIEASLR